MFAFLKKIRRKFLDWKLKKLDAHSYAEAMRPYFYYLGRNVKLYKPQLGTEPYLISIDDVVCASGVIFINHDVSCFNVARYLNVDERTFSKVGPISLHKNAFIGAKTILMPNTSVGENSIVAAGSVVTKKIPDGEVWGGNPAKFIMTTKQYAEKLISNNDYPWIDSQTGLLKNVEEEELISIRQKFFFK